MTLEPPVTFQGTLVTASKVKVISKMTILITGLLCSIINSSIKHEHKKSLL